MEPVSWFVPGLPTAQGSKRYVGRGIMLDTNPKLKSWRACVSQACPMEAPLSGAIRLTMVFNFPRPKSHYGTRKGEPYLKADAPWFKSSTPDADKLARAIGDALTGVAYVDDAQIAELYVRKLYTEGIVGVRITLHML